MRLRPGLAALTIAASITASFFVAAPASADESTDSLVSSSCLTQLKEKLDAENRTMSESQMNAACTGDVTSTVSPIHYVSASEARALAASSGFSRARTVALVARAEQGWVAYRDWKTSYKSWFVKEAHEGRTYFDGENAWVTENKGYTGKHVCHAEGSSHWFVHVDTRECTQPDPSAEVDNAYQFEVSLRVFGVETDYVIGLHTHVNRAGDVWYDRVDHI